MEGSEGSEAGEDQELILYDIVTYREWEQEPEVHAQICSTRGVVGGLQIPGEVSVVVDIVTADFISSIGCAGTKIQPDKICTKKCA